MWRGARIGALAGIALAVLYIALGTRVSEVTELLGYSLVIVGFPALFAAIPVVQALGLLLSSPAAPDGHGD
jgi:hypothetical protein